ncbi:glycosyltransferase family 2 protein [Gordonia aquimaris]|uniref:glycosyltransferase family 2 protein n=1 Tax=Gordonia aquimaris TaxID=2984863 RepID=UPI003557743E
MPRLSVIMPAHNAERTIHSAVSSTLYALPRDSELVVGLDGSTDGSLEILGSTKDPRLRILESSTKLGVASTLNRLLDATDSKVVARMDADDVSLPWRFRQQERAYVPGTIQFGNVAHFGDGFRVPRPVAPLPIRPHVSVGLLLFENPFAHPTMFANREVIARLGSYREVPAQDYDLWMRAATSRVAMSRAALPVVAYRHHDSQITGSSASDRRKAESVALAKAHRDLCDAIIGVSLECWPTLRQITSASVGDERGDEVRTLAKYARALSANWSSTERRLLERAISRTLNRATRVG